MSTNRSPEWRGISRIDYKHTHGWFARVYLKGKRVKSKLFSDGLHESREDALKKAQEWRDNEKKNLAPEDRPKKVRYYKKATKNNTSGRVGISKTFTRSKADKNQKLWCFSVTWAPTPGKPRNRSFYFSIYGSEEAAFKAACDFREEKERELDGKVLSKEEREQQLRKNIEQIMTYFNETPEHRQERLQKIHALILDEFPDVKMWMKSTHPCYQRGERWIMLSNRKRSISIQFHPTADFAAFLPHHYRSMISETCVHYRDTVELRLDDLRMLVREVLGSPNHTDQHHEPADAEQAAQPKETGKPKAAKKSQKIQGYARTTKAIRRYMEKAPKARQKLLWELHTLIVDAFPIVRLTVENNVPAYENNGAWLMLNNQKDAVAIAVSNNDALAEFTAKHPELKSGDAGLMIKETANIPMNDFQEFALNVLTSDSEQEEDRQPAETPEAASQETSEAVPEAKRSRPLNAAKETIAAGLKRKRGRLRKTDKQPKPATLQAPPLPDDVRLYIEAASETQRERLMSLHYLILATCPDVEVSMKYKMPSYVLQERWMSFKSQSENLTIYGSDSDSIKEFSDKHPDIKAGKMTLKIPGKEEIPTGDVQILVRKTLLAERAPQQQQPKQEQQPQKEQQQQLPEDVRSYIEDAPEDHRERLMSFHNAIVITCPDVDVSMKYKMPSYVRQEKWLSIKNQPQSITLYGSNSESIKEFADKYPSIKAGKMTLKIPDGFEIPADDILILIRKTLLAGETAPARDVADIVADTQKLKKPKKSKGKQALTVLTRPDPVEEYIRATPPHRQRRMRALHTMIAEEFPHLKQSTKFRRLTYEGRTMWMSIGNLEKSISVHVKNGIGIEEFLIKNPDVPSGATWVHLADAAKIPRKSFQVLVQRVFGPTEMKAAAEAKARMAAEAKAREAEKREAPVEAQETAMETPSENQPAPIATKPAPVPTNAKTQSTEAPTPKTKKANRPGPSPKSATQNVSAVSKPEVATEPPAPETTPEEKEKAKALQAVMGYITQYSGVRRERLLVLHSLVVGECPQVEMSLRLGMPTYYFQGRWVAIAHQRECVSLYVGDGSSLFDFVNAHPDIAAGKTYLNFVDEDEIPVSDTHAVIQKNLHPKTMKLDVA